MKKLFTQSKTFWVAIVTAAFGVYNAIAPVLPADVVAKYGPSVAALLVLCARWLGVDGLKVTK